MLPVIQREKPAAPKPRRKFPRLSLRSFLLVIAVLPLILGLYVRREMTRVRGYYIAQVAFSGTALELGLFNQIEAHASWRVDGFGRESLIYLVVQPSGDRGLSGGGPGYYEAPLVRTVPVWDDLAVEPNHVYCGGKRLSNDRYPTAWLYLTSSHQRETAPGVFEKQPVQVQMLKVPLDELKISREEFARFPETELWRKHFQPDAEAEAKRWWRQHCKRFGFD